MLFALLLVGLTVSGLIFSARARSDEAEPAAVESPIPPSAVELPKKRTATSDTFELHSGMLETRVYGTPVNFKDAEGEWQPIEEGLEETEGGGITNGANSVEVSLPTELQEGAARLSIGDQWIASKLLSAETEPAQVSEGAAVYESPQANAAFEYTTLAEGLKEEIELKGPSSPSTFRYQLTASGGLSADLLEDGSVVFRDGQGEVVASLPAPTVADAESLAPNPNQVSYQLAPRENGAWVLTVSVDREWLEAPERKFPVTVDPTMIAEKPDLDCVIGGKTGQEGWIDCASWGRQNLLAGYNAEPNQAEDGWYRSLMYLSTAGIPKGADVSSASLELHSPEAAKNTSGVGVYQVTKPWTWQANWKNYDKEKPWTTEGGDFYPQALGEVKTAVRGSGAGWWSVPIEISPGQEGTGEDLSVIVKLLDDKVRECGTTGCTHRLLKFDSSAATTIENRPYLRVLYNFRDAPASNAMSAPEEGRKTSHYFTLKSKWAANFLGEGPTSVSYQIKLPGWEEFRPVPAKYVLNGKGEAVEWPLPITSPQGESEPLFFDYPKAARAEHWALVEENIKLRAVFAGNHYSRGASEPVTVEYAGIYGGVGAPTDAAASVGPANLDLLTGQYTISRTDVSIPVPGSESNLEFTRTYESNYRNQRVPSTALGGMWQPSAPMEQAYEGEAWTALYERHQNAVPPVYEEECWEESGKIECEKWMAEEEIPAADWIELTDNEGGSAAFEIVGGAYVAPEYMKEYTLAKEGEAFVLASPEGTRTVFTKTEIVGGEYRPTTVSWQATAKSARMVYELTPSSYLLKKMISPPPPGVSSCGDTTSTTTPGCRTLAFQYFTCNCSGNYRLSSIGYYNATGSGSGQTVAQYAYDPKYRLIEEWDPRTAVNGGAPLKETYSYDEWYKLKSLTPPGQAPWQFEYYDWASGFENMLKSVSRASLVEATPTATTTVAYQVPISGSGAPYDMSPATVATWGQGDYPVDATAIFPPDQVPSSSHPTDFSHATVHYLDPEGYEVNSASAPPPGAEGPSISTAETDMHGNVVRELSPQNRLLALKAGSSSAVRSHELDSHSTYSADGTEMLESWGPLHSVRLEGGETKEARAHTVVKYEDPAAPAGQPAYHLPTKETTGALLTDGTEAEQRVTETHYNWNLRKPKETIVDPGGEGHLHITSVTVYDEATGLPVETRQPSNSGGGGAGTTKTVYYNGGKVSGSPYPECEENRVYAGLPCKTLPAAQASGTGRPQLLVTTAKSYNGLDEPTEVVESPGGGSENVRKTLFTYDEAGRQTSKKIIGGGVPIPKVETEYSPTLGLPTAERFKCEEECEGPQYLSAFGLGSPTHSRLNLPTDVAVDASGNTWVVDNANNRIVEYNEAGEFLREAGGKGSAGGKLEKPSAISIDSSGNLDVTDTNNNRVAQFSSTGAFIEVIGSNVNKTKVESGGTTLEKNRCTAASGNVCQAGTSGSGEGQISEPIGITSTATGTNFYVVERADNRVEKFNTSGEVLAKFGELGSGNGQLKEPTAIALHGFLLWVADTGNERMEAFTTSYVYSRKFGGEGSGNGPLGKPVGVEADSSGNVWVAEQANNRVQKFSETGTSLLKFGTQGSAEGQFSYPAGLAIDAKGNVLVADMANNRVQKWSASGFDTQETKTSYDSLGRPYAYEDADGNKAEASYDLDGRPVKTTDAKGWQVMRYDSTTGMPVELEDSAAGLFTASYNADGSMTKQTLPDGLTAETTYDATGAPIHLSYTKASNCGTSCLWLDFGLERSITGQIRKETGTLGTDHYSYDKAGRLVSANETPTGGGCTTRIYTYDEDSNRKSLTTRAPGIGGACASSGGTTQSYEYDAADRLMGPTYDSFGRITSLPAAYAGGKTLTTSYFADDMVASQSQGGITNSFQLDASLRQRVRLQGGGVEGTEVFHYDGPSDSPAWTERASTWTRSIVGLGGELAAVQESGKEITLQLTNLHGDVSATAAISPEVTSLKATFSYDEFGNPTSGGAGRYGWLGGKQRRTELTSGVIQMGARTYIPQLGRFLTPDPVLGGSANPYDYAFQDPINAFDLTGLTGVCSKQNRASHCVTAKEIRRRTRKEARSHHVKEFHTICVGKAGCYTSQTNSGSGRSLTDLGSELVEKGVHYLTSHVEAKWNEYYNEIKSVIHAANSVQGKKLESCAKGAFEGFAETKYLMDAGPYGEGAVATYSAVRCAIGYFG